MNSLTAFDFAFAFGTSVERLPPDVLNAIARADFRYDELNREEYNQVIQDILRTLKADLPRTDQPDRIEAWEKGWRERLAEYGVTGRPSSLIPRDFFKHKYARWQGDIIHPVSRGFEADFYSVVVRMLAHEYLREAHAIVDFGCGTGAALLILSESLCPNEGDLPVMERSMRSFAGVSMPLIGCDWAKGSQEILSAIATKTGLLIEGHNFNMLKPEDTVPRPMFWFRHVGVITVHAMEQLGDRFRPFLDYLLAKRPAVCVHLEPIVELYLPNNFLLDALAVEYHRKRGYLEGFLPTLRELERKGEVDIVDARRLGFGSLYHEAYSAVVWRPR